jgi:hypothetical protein
MSIVANKVALAEAAKALQSHYPELGDWKATVVARDVLDAFMAVGVNDLSGHGLGYKTKQLMRMSIGSSVLLDNEGYNKHKWIQAKRTAKRNMMEPTAQWKIEVVGETNLRITRLPDGTAIFNHGKGLSPVPKAMAEMRVGQVIQIKARKLENEYRRTARRLLNNPNAMWRSWTVNGMLEIKRTA